MENFTLSVIFILIRLSVQFVYSRNHEFINKIPSGVNLLTVINIIIKLSNKHYVCACYLFNNYKLNQARG